MEGVEDGYSVTGGGDAARRASFATSPADTVLLAVISSLSPASPPSLPPNSGARMPSHNTLFAPHPSFLNPTHSKRSLSVSHLLSADAAASVTEDGERRAEETRGRR